MNSTQSPVATSLAAAFEEAFRFHEQGNFEEATRRYRTILANHHDHLESLLQLGLISLQRGIVSEAEKLFREAVGRDPSSGDAQLYLANVLLAESRFNEAIAHYKATLRINPNNAEAHYGLGAALQGSDRAVESIAAYRTALALDPSYAEAAFGLGTALQLLHRDDEAIVLYQRALEVDPDYPEANHNLATALQARNHYEEAVRLYKVAIGKAPNFADAYNNLGVALTEVGALADAREILEQAITLNPKRPGIYQNLFSIKKAAVNDPHFVALQTLAQDVHSMPPDWQIALHFTMGKALEDVGEHERSFNHYLEGNALKRRQVQFDEAQVTKRLIASQSIFSRELMQAWQGLGNPSPVPIFIVGMPRSGSTLIEQILAAHPRVFAAGERLRVRDALTSFFGGEVPNRTFPDWFLTATQQELNDLGGDYLQRLRAATIGGPMPKSRQRIDFKRITDKLPSNFGVLGAINLALPKAHIIHSRRNPIDTCLSCFSTLFSSDQGFTWDLGELGRYYRSYVSQMEHWHRVLPPHTILDVQYEELIADFEPQARRIIAHCGLEWDDACLAFDKASRPVKTASSAQVRRPIYRSSIGRWRPDATILKPLIEGLGPDLVNGRT